MAITLGDAVVNITTNLEGVQEGIGKAKGKITSGLKGIGGKATKFLAGGLVKGAAVAGTAIAAIGATAFNVAREVEGASRQMQAALGLTAEESKALADDAAKVWSSGFADSINEASEAITYAKQQLDGLTADDNLGGITENAFKLQKVFGTDVTESISTVRTLMENFGITSDEAFDLLTTGFQRGLNRTGDFTESINEYSVQFANAGASASDFFGFLESGLEGGALGTDKAADAFKEFAIRIVDGSDATAEAANALFGFSGSIIDNGEAIGSSEEKLAKYREQLRLATIRQGEFTDKTSESTRLRNQMKIDDLTRKIAAEEAALSGLAATQGTYSEGLEGLIDYEGGAAGFFEDLRSGTLTSADAFSLVTKALSEIEDPIKRSELGVALLGSQFEDLGQDLSGLSLESGAFEDIEGSTDGLNVKFEDLGTALEVFRRKSIDSLRPLGEKMLELINQYSPQLLGALSWIEEKLPGMVDVGVEAFQGMINWIGKYAPPIIDKVTEAFQAIEEWFATAPLDPVIEVFQNIGEALVEVWEFVQELAELFLGEFLDGFESTGGAGQILTDTVNILREAWVELEPPIKEIADWFGKWLPPALRFASRWLGYALVEAIKDLGETFESLIDTVIVVVELFAAIVNGDWKEVWDILLGIAQEIWEQMKRDFNTELDAIKTILGNFNLFQQGKDMMNSFWDGIKDIVQQIDNWLRNFTFSIPKIDWPQLPSWLGGGGGNSSGGGGGNYPPPSSSSNRTTPAPSASRMNLTINIPQTFEGQANSATMSRTASRIAQTVVDVQRARGYA